MSNSGRFRDTGQFLHEQIPLAHAMGVQVESDDEKQLILTAPLTLNHNHLGTAFGGSLSAIATLAGYALLWLELNDRKCHIVISKSSTNFRRPVRGAIRAICHRPDTVTLAEFKERFVQKGKAQIALGVTIEEKGRIAVEFEGLYIAIQTHASGQP